jgi:peptide/nickel transport system substrate-binding protein
MKYNKTLLFILVSLLCLSMVLSACQTSTPVETVAPQTEAPTQPTTKTEEVVQPTAQTEPPTQAPAAGEPVKGGTIVLIIPEEPPFLNKYMTTAAVIWQVADATSTTTLTKVDQNGEFQPVLAVEVPTAENGGLSADYLTVTWKLKPDLKWSDGVAFTSDDVKFTYEVLTNPASGATSVSGFDQIDSVETPDAQTVVIHYKTPYVGYVLQFKDGLFPRHASGTPETMSNWGWNTRPVAMGPFVVTDWVSGDSITMEANPNYFEKGKPYLDRLIFKIVPEPAAQTAMMKTGEAQVHLWPGETKQEYDTLLAGIGEQVMVPGIWNAAIDFNLSKPFDNDPTATIPHPIFGDVNVRRAISHAIDYTILANDVVTNVDITTSPMAYGWYKCDLPRKYDYDPAAANDLLDKAGWVMGSDGIRVAKGAMFAEDGTRLTFEMLSYPWEPMQKTQQFIAENLKAVGIEVTLQVLDMSVLFGTYGENGQLAIGDFDTDMFDRGFNIEPQGSFFNWYSSTAVPGPDNQSGHNWPRWINKDADAALAAAGGTFDQAARKTAYCNLAQLIIDEVPQIFLYNFKDGYGFNNKVQGYTVSTWGSMTWDVQNWWLKQ